METMTPEQRAEAFKQGVAELERKYGYTVTAAVIVDQEGAEFRLKPQLLVAPIEGWQPPQEQS